MTPLGKALVSVNFEAEGARGAAPWLPVRARLPRKVAAAQLRRGRALCELPATAAGYALGMIGPARVDALAGLLSRPTREALVAEELSYGHLRVARSCFTQLADPDGAEAGAED